jgi:hypothetical protein
VGNGNVAVTAANNDPASSGGEEADRDGQAGISEILVVGSRSQNVDIRRTEDDAQPYVILSGDQIRRSGAVNVEEFLRQQRSNGSRFSLRRPAESMVVVLLVA